MCLSTTYLIPSGPSELHPYEHWIPVLALSSMFIRILGLDPSPFRSHVSVPGRRFLMMRGLLPTLESQHYLSTPQDMEDTEELPL